MDTDPSKSIANPIFAEIELTRGNFDIFDPQILGFRGLSVPVRVLTIVWYVWGMFISAVEHI